MKTFDTSKKALIVAASKLLKPRVEAGEFETINQGLIELYALQGNTDLKTFDEWVKQGKHIKKGASALLLWGKKQTKTIIKDDKEVEITFFPVKSVFSSTQVY